MPSARTPRQPTSSAAITIRIVKLHAAWLLGPSRRKGTSTARRSPDEEDPGRRPQESAPQQQEGRSRRHEGLEREPVVNRRRPLEEPDQERVADGDRREETGDRRGDETAAKPILVQRDVGDESATSARRRDEAKQKGGDPPEEAAPLGVRLTVVGQQAGCSCGPRLTRGRKAERATRRTDRPRPWPWPWRASPSARRGPASARAWRRATRSSSCAPPRPAGRRA